MNPDSTQFEANGSNPSQEPVPPTPARDWRYWMRRLLICNPLFLCSAALLLWGINRLSADDNLFLSEVQNLYFNFSVLQFYEVLVVVTAIVLSRRKIWYDSALLVVLEQGLALVPFMLISQATLQGEFAREGLTLAATLSLGGGAVMLARCAAIRRWYPGFNLPGRSLLLGAVILAGNVALPLIFRPRMEKDVADWQDENLLLWYYVLPIVAAGANLLLRPSRYGGTNAERHWLPLFIYGLWITGSAVHVWSIAHICELPLQAHHLAPLACVIAWTLRNRLSDFYPAPAYSMQLAALLLTVAAPLLAFAESHLFFTLMSVTFVAHVVLWLKASDRNPLRATMKHLAFVSFALVIAGVPLDWGRLAVPFFTRANGLVIGGVLFVLIHAAQSRRPALGIAGAAALFSALVFHAVPLGIGFHVTLQASLVFLLLHSLRWNDSGGSTPPLLRWISAMCWVLDSLAWTRDPNLSAILGTTMMAVVVAAGWLVVWRMVGRRPSMALPIAAVGSLCSGGGNWILRHGSDGLLIVLGSFALFAIGATVAWTRHRWEGSRSDANAD